MKSMKNIKKIILSLAVAAATLVSVPATASAAPNFIEGTVVINGLSAANANVTVTCNGFAKKVKTSAGGFYSASFSTTKCPVGSTVNVTAQKGNKGGVTQKTVTGPVTTANVTVSTVAVPEFGPAAAVGTLGIAAGGFMVIRRRKLGQLNQLQAQV